MNRWKRVAKCVWLCWLLLAPFSRAMGDEDVGPLVRALWLVQSGASRTIYNPALDESVKSTLAKALAIDGVIRFDEVADLFDTTEFRKLTEGRDQMNAHELKTATDRQIPESRSRMKPSLVSHLNLLTTTFDQVDDRYHASTERLSAWIAANYRDDLDLHVIVVCTGNSRRSILGSSLGNAAASYYGLERLHFHSGGTAPTAFNRRTIAALTEIGFEILATGEQAPRGEPSTANSVYSLSWGDRLTTREFSKHYSDDQNPRQRFAAIMVCTEADAECPNVVGAQLRLAMPFLDPKMYDDSPFEKAKYAERRDDIGRTLLLAVCQAKQQLDRLKESR